MTTIFPPNENTDSRLLKKFLYDKLISMRSLLTHLLSVLHLFTCLFTVRFHVNALSFHSPSRVYGVDKCMPWTSARRITHSVTTAAAANLPPTATNQSTLGPILQKVHYRSKLRPALQHLAN